MKKIHTLVADDSKIELNCVCHLANRFNLPLHIELAHNGKQALEVIESKSIDLLLTDVKMPFLDGLSLAKEALKVKNDLKIVIFSSFGEFEYAKTAMGLGIQDYLLKPIDPTEFKEVLGRVSQSLQKTKEKKRKTSPRVSPFLPLTGAAIW